MSLYSAIITLLLVMDPIGNIPVFISVLKHLPSKRRTQIIVRESFIAFLILILFLFTGKSILHGLGVSEYTLSISGGIILFLIALKMIFPPKKGEQEPLDEEPFIVPLAVPLIAGPSAIATVLLLATTYPESLSRWFLAILCALLVSAAILIFADKLREILGQRFLTAIERLMGMILTTIALQMLFNGITLYLQTLK